MERQPTEWKSIFACTSDKGLISKIYKALINLSTKKTNSIKTWAKDLNRHFSKEHLQMTNTQKESCSVSVTIREMQTTLRYHLTQAKMVILNKSTKDKYWRG